MLDRHEDAEAVARGEAKPFRDGRPLAHSYVRYLMERRRDRSIVAFRAIYEMDRSERLALEPECCAWPGRGRPLPAGAPAGELTRRARATAPAP